MELIRSSDGVERTESVSDSVARSREVTMWPKKTDTSEAVSGGTVTRLNYENVTFTNCESIWLFCSCQDMNVNKETRRSLNL
jgi:hypothetical protein